MVLFKDISKTSTDLITRDFPHNSPLDLEVKSVSAPVTITATATVDKAAHDASVQAAYAAGNVRASAKVSATAATLDATFAVPKEFKLAGLSFQAKHDIKKGKATTELAAEYFADRCHSRFSFFPVVNTFAASSLFSCSTSGACKLGAQVTGGIDGKDIKYSLGAVSACKVRGVSFSARTAPATCIPNEVILTSHMKKGDMDVAVQAAVRTDLKANVGVVVSRQVTPVLGYKLKFAEGKGAVALTQKLSDNASVCIGLEHDGKPEGLKIGTKFFFSQ